MRLLWHVVMIHQPWVRKVPVELAKVDELITFPLHFIRVIIFTIALWEIFKLNPPTEKNQKLILGIFGISDPPETVIKILKKINLCI